MAAEIIEFPERGRDRLASSIARLETIVREVERIVADEPEAGVDRLLAIMERMGDQLVDLASLVLDEESKQQAQKAFISLSDKIAETRLAFEQVGDRTRN
jgi:ParB-like chromosome segregation protein Spo0J